MVALDVSPLTMAFRRLPSPTCLPHLLSVRNLALPRPFISHPCRTSLLLATPLHPRICSRRISDDAKAYFRRESFVFAKAILFGYGFLAVAAGASSVGAFLYIESLFPPPKGMPFGARFGLDFSRALTRWAEKYDGAIKVMRDAVASLGESGWAGKSSGWRKGYMICLKYLAELEEHEGMVDDARAHYQQILQLPREGQVEEELWQEERVAAALRISKICEFKKDLPGAQAALVNAVSFARGSRPTSEGTPAILDGLPLLPDPRSRENTPLFLKALTELSIFYARNGRQHLALELLTTILRARRSAPPPPKPGDSVSANEISDPCAEAVTMTYLGELLFAMGSGQQGLAWTKEAYQKSEGLAELRGACKECAIVAGRNVSRMLEIMKEERGSAPTGGRGWFRRGVEKPSEQNEGREEWERSIEEWERSTQELEKIRVTKGK